MPTHEDYALAQAALNGDKHALEQIILRIQDDVYNLALRFLAHPADAEDAAQEILIKVTTNLSRFNGASALRTWVYRVAVNYLLDTRERLAERRTFALLEVDLRHDLDAIPYDQPDRHVLAEEIKIGCTLGMLACLPRDQRIAYILGEILRLDSNEAGAIVETTPETFRKRLSIARQRLRDFMQTWCGIANPNNPCRCGKRINYGLERGRIDSQHLAFADAATYLRAVEQVKEHVERAVDAADIYRGHPTYRAPPALLDNIKQVLAWPPLQRFLDADTTS